MIKKYLIKHLNEFHASYTKRSITIIRSVETPNFISIKGLIKLQKTAKSSLIQKSQCMDFLFFSFPFINAKLSTVLFIKKIIGSWSCTPNMSCLFLVWVVTLTCYKNYSLSNYRFFKTEHSIELVIKYVLHEKSVYLFIDSQCS